MATLRALQFFGFFWAPAAKAIHLQELVRCFRPRLYLMPKIEYLQKKKLHSNHRYNPAPDLFWSENCRKQTEYIDFLVAVQKYQSKSQENCGFFAVCFIFWFIDLTLVLSFKEIVKKAFLWTSSANQTSPANLWKNSPRNTCISCLSRAEFGCNVFCEAKIERNLMVWGFDAKFLGKDFLFQISN